MSISKESLIHKMPFQQQILLTAIYCYIKREDALFVSFKQLQNELKRIYASLNINPRPVSEHMLRELEQYALVGVEKKQFEMRIPLKIALSEVEQAFQEHSVLKKFV